MNKTKHTPGPWTAFIEESVNVIAIMAGGEIGRGGREIVGWTGFDGNSIESVAENAANARLIAAAPDLLEACEAALHAFEDNWAINWEDLSVAIAKARGEVTP